MNIYIIPVIVIVSLAISRTTYYFEGYNLDTGRYLITGLLAILFSVVFTLAPIVRLANPEFRNIKYLLVSLICVGAWFVSYSSLTPSGLDGAAARLGQYTEQDYQRISRIIQEQSEVHGISEQVTNTFSEKYKSYINGLKTSHEIFSISAFPIDVFVGENADSIQWSSGLTGGYELLIIKQQPNLNWLVDRKKRYVYENVVVYLSY